MQIRPTTMHHALCTFTVTMYHENVYGEAAGLDKFEVQVLPAALKLLVGRAAAPSGQGWTCLR